MMRKIGHNMMVFMSKRMIACDEASFLVSYRSEHRLGFKQWWQLKMHLLTCHLCRKYAHQIKEMNLSIDKYRESCSHDTCSHHLSDEASSKIQHALDSELDAK